jgi:hypothetical protein
MPFVSPIPGYGVRLLYLQYSYRGHAFATRQTEILVTFLNRNSTDNEAQPSNTTMLPLSTSNHYFSFSTESLDDNLNVSECHSALVNLIDFIKKWGAVELDMNIRKHLEDVGPSFFFRLRLPKHLSAATREATETVRHVSNQNHTLVTTPAASVTSNISVHPAWKFSDSVLKSTGTTTGRPISPAVVPTQQQNKTGMAFDS